MNTDILNQLTQITSELYNKCLITPTGGNLSARCEDQAEEFWITPAGTFKGDLQADMMVRINLSGEAKTASAYTASSEWRMHSAIYRLHPKVKAVVHTHAPQSTLMALSGTNFLPISYESAFLGEIPCVPFILPGTDELGQAVANALGEGCAVLMQNHGLVVAAGNLRRAADITDIVEVTALKLLTCRALGVTPPVLADEVVKRIREEGNLQA